MSIKFPGSRKEVETRAKADVQASLENSNPFLKNSFLGALITGFSGRVYEFYLQLKNLLDNMFPDTATGSFIERHGSYVGINRNPETRAVGQIILTGVAGSVIPVNSLLTSQSGNSYYTNLESEITLNVINVSSVVRSGSTVTVTTVDDHGFGTGQDVQISGAVETEYNGTRPIVVVSADVFTYTITTTPASPATGTILAAYNMTSVEARSVGYGQIQNLSNGELLTLSTPIGGVDNTAYVTFAGISSGTDTETDTLYRQRVLYRYQNPLALFNTTAINIEAFKQPGVTRVWVREAGEATSAISVSSIVRAASIATVVTATNHYLEDGQYVTISGVSPSGYNTKSKVIVIDNTTFAYVVDSGLGATSGTMLATPSIPNGQVKIYFTRDNDSYNIPSATEVTEVKNRILSIKPAHTDAGDVIVKAPAPVAVSFDFTELTPNTPAMKTAIQTNLTNLFREDVDVGVDLQSQAYISAIWQTVDSTGAIVTDFTLSTPSGDVTILEGELPVLSAVTFSI